MANEQSGKSGTATATAPSEGTAPPPVSDAQNKPNDKETAAREAALEKAQLANNRAANKIAADWARQDKTLKTWMVDMGARCHGLMVAECATDKPYTVALSDLRVRLLTTTGEDKGADITRCIRLYFAALTFGAEPFAKLPIRGQKEFGTLLEGATDEQTKTTVYVLTPATADKAKAAFAVACGDNVKDTPAGLKRTKDGTLEGEAIAKMVAVVKAGKDPLAPPAPAAEGGKEGEQPPAGGAKDGKKNGKEGTTENATGERPAAAGPVKLDVKPAIAGGELVRMLAEHEAAPVVLHSAAKAKEFKAEHVEAIISGLADAGRLDDIRRIVSFAGRELRIAAMMAKEKCDRQEAITKLDAQDMRRAG